FLMHVCYEGVRLGRCRVGMDFRGIVSALGTLIAVGIGASAMGLRKPFGLGVCICVPACFLLNMIAGVDGDAGAARRIAGIEAEGRWVDDGSLEYAVATIPGAVAAGVYRFKVDRIGNIDRWFGNIHASLHVAFYKSPAWR